MRIHERLRRLEKQRDPADLPIKILTYGAWDGDDDDDGLYHEGGRTYTEEEKQELATRYRLVIVCYGDWPPGDDGGERRQMTWGDDDPAE